MTGKQKNEYVSLYPPFKPLASHLPSLNYYPHYATPDLQQLGNIGLQWRLKQAPCYQQKDKGRTHNLLKNGKSKADGVLIRVTGNDARRDAERC